MNRKTVCLLMVAFGIPITVSAQIDTSDSLTITTYYPSPYGVYGTLKLQPKRQPATCREGEMTYSNNTTPRGLYYCNETNAWQLIGAGSGGGGYWQEDSDGYLSNINSGGQVIIKGQPGATGPNEEIFEAQGDIRVFHRPPLGDGNTLIYLTRSNATSLGTMGFTTWDGSDPGYGIVHWGTPQKLSIQTGPPGWVRSLTIADDKVGIGTTTPQQKLEVNGAMRLAPVAAPAGSPPAGTVYYDSSRDTPRYYDSGNQWNNFISEYGSVTFNSGDTLKTVNFRKTYSQLPLVIATPVMIGAPADGGLTVSIRQLTNTFAQFDVDVVDEWDNDVDDTVHQQTQVHYIVIPRN